MMSFDRWLTEPLDNDNSAELDRANATVVEHYADLFARDENEFADALRSYAEILDDSDLIYIAQRVKGETGEGSVNALYESLAELRANYEASKRNDRKWIEFADGLRGDT